MRAYKDPTADLAIGHVMAEEKRKRKGRSGRGRTIALCVFGEEAAMGRMFEPEDETYVYDQCCRNCKWWNPDPVSDKMKCRNYRSEQKGKEMPDGDGWCWCWQSKGVCECNKESWRSGV